MLRNRHPAVKTNTGSRRLAIHLITAGEDEGQRHSLGDDVVLLGEPREAVVRLAHAPDVAADGVRLAFARVPAGGRVHQGDVHLDRGVILGRDQPIAGRAASIQNTCQPLVGVSFRACFQVNASFIKTRICKVYET